MITDSSNDFKRSVDKRWSAIDTILSLSMIIMNHVIMSFLSPKFKRLNDAMITSSNFSRTDFFTSLEEKI